MIWIAYFWRVASGTPLHAAGRVAGGADGFASARAYCACMADLHAARSGPLDLHPARTAMAIMEADQEILCAMHGRFYFPKFR